MSSPTPARVRTFTKRSSSRIRVHPRPFGSVKIGSSPRLPRHHFSKIENASPLSVILRGTASFIVLARLWRLSTICLALRTKSLAVHAASSPVRAPVCQYTRWGGARKMGLGHAGCRAGSWPAKALWIGERPERPHPSDPPKGRRQHHLPYRAIHGVSATGAGNGGITGADEKRRGRKAAKLSRINPRGLRGAHRHVGDNGFHAGRRRSGNAAVNKSSRARTKQWSRTATTRIHLASIALLLHCDHRPAFPCLRFLFRPYHRVLRRRRASSPAAPTASKLVVAGSGTLLVAAA
jgi:hypothetical protein